MWKESTLNKVIALRFLRGLGAVLVAFVVAWLAGPDAIALIPSAYYAVVVAAVTPVLLALEKYLRDGGDAEA